MISRIFSMLICLLLTRAAIGQQLHFETDSLGKVLQRARQLQKPVFLLFESLPPSTGLTKQEIAQRYRSGLNEVTVVRVLQQDFLSVKVSISNPEGRRLARQYRITTFPTYLYLHPDGTVLHRSFGNTSEASRYLLDIDTFRRKLTAPDNLSVLEQRYAQGERNMSFLRQYIEARRSVGAFISPELLDSYVRELPVKAFEEFAQVLFVYQCGPLVDSRAYRLARLNQRLIDSIYTTLPLASRTALNDAIISNTMQAAIKGKDERLAQRGADFARGSWRSSRSYVLAQHAYSQNMLFYYRAVNDTARYLPLLSSFYEQYYMAMPADSVRKWQKLLQDNRTQFRAATPYPNLSQSDASVTTQLIANPRSPDPLAADLNNGAWAVYKSGTRRSTYLTQALRWSQRSVALQPQAAYYDTLAHLLYALRLHAEAEATEQQAIAQAKKEGRPIEGFQQALRKIKTRTL
ncbi:hypothetical protein [Hymenobacter sediminicola]|uniref:Thioredoxin family protein n=1 Tax=Hymenobacter sediminicola TaxID=2761579 RepID=A0A7G7W6Q2_9BACT|nr:hypothetical protein [Hymenobacter sediminicola]QNH62045.1 hypothetical protein H4317_18170 [Hymenobacter sediminicola]